MLTFLRHGLFTSTPFRHRALLLAAAVALILFFSWRKLLCAPAREVTRAAVKAPSVFYTYPDVFAIRKAFSNRFEVRRHRVRPGDTFISILKAFGLPARCSHRWRKQCRDFRLLNNLHPGDQISIYLDKANHRPIKIRYRQANHQIYVFRFLDGGWQCHDETKKPIELDQIARGTICDNLFASCLRSGLPAQLIVKLADLFAYDIDFNTDIHSGDAFAVYFRQRVMDGRLIDAGPILAACMTVAGHRVQAFYYEFPDGTHGYFDEQGRSLRKMFLKAPLSYRRITSTFTYRRYHPILKIYRPHLGIDYAAPAGTPVSALGDGRVVYKGRNGGFGNYIVLKHGTRYKTTYGHLSRFARGLRVGQRVEQGQVIGYVGATGLATGPHLDFRFYRDGKPINFLRTRFPHARSVPPSLLADFNAKRQRSMAMLERPVLSRLKPLSP